MSAAGKRLLSSSRGFTLVEVLVAISILSVVVGIFTTSTFQVLSIQRTWRDNVLATRELRHVVSVFAGDALNASTSTVSADSATLNWTDTSNATHTITYSLSGSAPEKQLIRQYNGVSSEVARRVESVSFSLSGKMLRLDLSVWAAQGKTASTTSMTFLRNLE